MADLPADLRLRRELIERIATVLEARMQREALTLRQAAETLGVSHPRIADLLARRAERFSLDRLALLAEQLGLNVRIRATRPYGMGGNVGLSGVVRAAPIRYGPAHEPKHLV